MDKKAQENIRNAGRVDAKKALDQEWEEYQSTLRAVFASAAKPQIEEGATEETLRIETFTGVDEAVMESLKGKLERLSDAARRLKDKL